MKKLKLFLIVALIAAFAIPALCLAQAATNSPAAGLPDASIAIGFLTPVIAALTAKYGWLLTVLAWIAVLRVAMKPIMLVVEAVIQATPSTDDDAKLANFEQGPIYKWFMWGLDFLASFKTPTALKTGTSNPLVKQ
jgi:hypothetical protein